MDEKDKLFVPAKIPLGWQMWPGFGKKEALITLVVFAVSVIGCVIAVNAGVSLFAAIFTVITLTGITIAVVQKNSGISIADYIKLCIRFRTNQQFYLNKHGKESFDVEQQT